MKKLQNFILSGKLAILLTIVLGGWYFLNHIPQFAPAIISQQTLSVTTTEDDCCPELHINIPVDTTDFQKIKKWVIKNGQKGYDSQWKFTFFIYSTEDFFVFFREDKEEMLVDVGKNTDDRRNHFGYWLTPKKASLFLMNILSNEEMERVKMGEPMEDILTPEVGEERIRDLIQKTKEHCLFLKEQALKT